MGFAFCLRSSVPVPQSNVSHLFDLTLCLCRYEPRYYLFPVFEIVRRVFLSAVLALFLSGSVTQILLGAFGALLSWVVYSYTGAFINDDDDLVSTVAALQLVLIYVSALAIYAADFADQTAYTRGSFLGGLLVVFFFASFLVAAYVTLLDVFSYKGLLDAYNSVLAGGWNSKPEAQASPSISGTSEELKAQNDEENGFSSPSSPSGAPEEAGTLEEKVPEEKIPDDDDDDDDGAVSEDVPTVTHPRDTEMIELPKRA